MINLLNSVHTLASDDDAVINAVLGLIKHIDAAAVKRDKAAKYRSTNYGHKDQRILEGYSRQSVADSQAVRMKYDPTCVFPKNSAR